MIDYDIVDDVVLSIEGKVMSMEKLNDEQLRENIMNGQMQMKIYDCIRDLKYPLEKLQPDYVLETIISKLNIIDTSYNDIKLRNKEMAELLYEVIIAVLKKYKAHYIASQPKKNYEKEFNEIILGYKMAKDISEILMTEKKWDSLIVNEDFRKWIFKDGSIDKVLLETACYHEAFDKIHA